MTCIIDAIEDLFYGNPCAGEEPVEETHRVITTNIPKGSIEERIQQAQVIILLERHVDKEIHHLNGRVIRQLSKNGEMVLHEGSKVPKYLPYSIRSQAKSWDLPSSEERNKLFKEWSKHIYDVALVLPSYVSLTLSATSETLKKNDDGIQVLIQDFYPADGKTKFEAFREMNQEERISFLKELARECNQKLQDMEKRYMALIHEEFYGRTVHFIAKIDEALEKTSKVWAIAGEAHGRYMSPEHVQALDLFYQSLEAKNVSYLTLKWFDPTLQADEYSNDKSKAHLRQEKQDREIRESKSLDREDFFNDIPETLPPILQYSVLSDRIQDIEETFPMPIASNYAGWILERVITWSL